MEQKQQLRQVDWIPMWYIALIDIRVRIIAAAVLCFSSLLSFWLCVRARDAPPLFHQMDWTCWNFFSLSSRPGLLSTSDGYIWSKEKRGGKAPSKAEI